MAKIPEKLRKKIRELPDSPGVYKFTDRRGRVIYVGKALRLRRRVSSYFRPGKAGDSRMEMLTGEVRDIEFVRASSEAEALIYEAGLIKDHAPKFNVELKDDKSYPFLKLSVNEKYPRLYITRRRMADGALYYGPYVDVKLLRDALSFMKKVFPLRSCRKLKKKVCLEYHIGQCAGPCEKKVGDEEYGAIVGQLKNFLEGRKDDLLKELERRLKAFSEAREYEKALAVKNRIAALTAVRQSHGRSRLPLFGELDEMRNALGLKRTPVSIECFDVSNIGGRQAVGAMVKFVAGAPRKSDYRKFRIKEAAGADDYSMIREIVRRRYSRLVKEKGPLPDLVMIDGGKGHLSAAREVLDGLGLRDMKVVSIAKEFNHLYTDGRREAIRLSPGSRLLFLVQRIRDEAHRFAIKYHRSLRSRELRG